LEKTLIEGYTETGIPSDLSKSPAVVFLTRFRKAGTREYFCGEMAGAARTCRANHHADAMAIINIHDV